MILCQEILYSIAGVVMKRRQVTPDKYYLSLLADDGWEKVLDYHGLDRSLYYSLHWWIYIFYTVDGLNISLWNSGFEANWNNVSSLRKIFCMVKNWASYGVLELISSVSWTSFFLFSFQLLLDYACLKMYAYWNNSINLLETDNMYVCLFISLIYIIALDKTSFLVIMVNCGLLYF